MSFDGTEFLALDDDAADPDEPLDVYIDTGLRSNIEALLTLPQSIVWSPVTIDSSFIDRKNGVRPYASRAESTVLHVPWMLQEGQEAVGIDMHYRLDEEGDNTFPFGTVSLQLDGVRGGVGSINPTPSTNTTPDTDLADITVELPDIAGEDFQTNLKVLFRSSVTDEEDSDLAKYVVQRLGGSIVGNASATDPPLDAVSIGTTAPNADSLHLMTVQEEGGAAAFDVLGASTTENQAFTRPVSANAVPSELDGIVTRRLSYLQVRSCEISQTWGADTLTAIDSYPPQEEVTGADSVTHPLANDRAYRRKRPLWVGPRGQDAVEYYPTGYTYRFVRHQLDDAYQNFIVASIRPRTVSPHIRVMMNVLCWYRHSDPEVQFEIKDQKTLEEYQAFAEVDYRVRLSEYQTGSPSLATLATQTTSPSQAFYPAISTPVSTALITENIIARQNGRYQQTQDIRYAYKEGQLFPEDELLLQRVVLDIKFPAESGYTPAARFPVLVLIDAGIDVIADGDVGFLDADGFIDVPAGPTADISAARYSVTPPLDKGFPHLTVTGVSIWEVPQ